ncbi:MAG TPA: FAD-linked oxidase C-terminal domain-containing protein, partial [Verrucomicrobiae bacterium]|nr:FAD-linked oxidase C-terminal domain-containing protein [Verrucomicrobiae bacterium]
SVSGEHGIGVEKAEFMTRQFSPADLDAMKLVRNVFDPEGRCNPRKMFPTGKRCGDFSAKKQISA